ncbi:MAG: hypothetical protein ACRC17_12095 [Culicoidibacterales bacterium]
MKTASKIFGSTAILVTILVIGMIVGANIEQLRKNKESGNLYESDQIAIVNMDEGLRSQETQINYAKNLIANYSGNYLLTGIEDAKRGIENGKYSAYVVFPADFSKNVVSINTIPQKSILIYEISGVLSAASTDNAWQNVLALKEEVNNDLGYLYIHTILSEFHKGQDSVGTVLANDIRDQEVINAISSNNLVAALEIKDVERLEQTIQELELSNEFTENAVLMTALDKAYKGYIDATTEELTAIKGNDSILDSVTELESGPLFEYILDESGLGLNLEMEKLASVIHELESEIFTTTINDGGMESKKLISELEFDAFLEVLNELMELFHIGDQSLPNLEAVSNFKEAKTEVDNYLIEFLLDYIDYLYESFVDVEMTSQDILTLLDERMLPLNVREAFEVMRNQNSDVTNFVSYINNKIEVESAKEALIQDMQDIKESVQAKKIADTIDGYRKSWIDRREQIYHLLTTGIDSAVVKDFETLDQAQKTFLLDKITTIEKLKISIIDFYRLIENYDPTSKINTNEINSFINEFINNNSNSQRKITHYTQENSEFVSSVYNTSNKYIEVLRQDILKNKQESEEKVASGIERAKQEKAKNAVANSTVLNAYYSALPYTRNGSLANTVVYDFITAPTEIVGDKIVIPKQTLEIKNLYGVIISFGIASGLIYGILRLISYQRYKRLQNEE